MGARLFSDKVNNPKTERDFKLTKWYQCQCSGSAQLVSHDYQEYLNSYHRFLSLYLTRVIHDRTELVIYDTEIRRKEVKILDTSIIDDSATITQLPNGELFCYGGASPISGIALIIDRDYRIRILPSGTPCYSSSALYFNSNVYCFGEYFQDAIALSRKFDLNKNRWINLTSLPEDDYYCKSVIFNGNIFISGTCWSNLWLYSIEIDSFSIIPYDFAMHTRKILINIERLYLIEWDDNNLIYESNDGYYWKKNSKFGYLINGTQIYCLYNNGKIYFSTFEYFERYFQFDLKKKILYEFNCKDA